MRGERLFDRLWLAAGWPRRQPDRRAYTLRQATHSFPRHREIGSQRRRIEGFGERRRPGEVGAVCPQEHADGGDHAEGHLRRQSEPVEFTRGDAGERGTRPLPRRPEIICYLGRRRPAAENSAGAQWCPRVAAGRCDQGHRAGDRNDCRDALGDGRMRRECPLVRAVDHHPVLPGREARDDAAAVDVAQRRNQRGGILGQPHGFRVGNELS